MAPTAAATRLDSVGRETRNGSAKLTFSFVNWKSGAGVPERPFACVRRKFDDLQSAV